ncbi:MAG: hypothetical protein JJU35_12315 [Balneolales bacterium]|nr:hypothetical protein [Balneolales bacterium]
MKKQNLQNISSAKYFVALVLMLLFPALLSAQPSASQLISDIQRANAGYLSGVNTLSFVPAIEGMGFMMQERETLRKVTENGHPRLVGDEENDDISVIGLLNLSAADIATLVNGAARIGTETRDGSRMITLLIDDPAVIETLGEPMQDAGDEADIEDFSFVTMKLSLGASDHLLYHIESIMENEDGQQLEMHFSLGEYERHSGLPLPGRVSITMSGLAAMMDGEEMAEARREMEEMMRELENLPEAQRNMIMQQMGSQFEQFERMMEADETGFTIIVQDVRVNE